jgi:hypothetical protein
MIVASSHLTIPREHPGSPSAFQGSPICGVLVIIGAIMQDAAHDLARIEVQMAAARTDAAVLGHGVAALAVIDRARRLLDIQRETAIGRLTELALDVPSPGEGVPKPQFGRAPCRSGPALVS